MSKGKNDRFGLYIIIGITFITGFVLVGLGRSSEGYVLIGLSILIAVVTIPEVTSVVVSTLKGLHLVLRGLNDWRKKNNGERNTATYYPQQAEQSVTATDADLVRVIDVLNHCPLPSKFRHEPENDAETWISSQLVHDFPNHKRQQHYSQYHSRFDIEIGNIGVEVKLPKGARDIATLRGQITIYLKRFEHVVAFIINYYHIDPEIIDDFKRDMEKEYGGRVIVIERPLR